MPAVSVTGTMYMKGGSVLTQIPDTAHILYREVAHAKSEDTQPVKIFVQSKKTEGKRKKSSSADLSSGSVNCIIPVVGFLHILLTH